MKATNQVIPQDPLFYKSLQIDHASAIRGGKHNLARQQGGTNLVGHADDKME